MGGWTVDTCWWIYYAAAIGIVAATIIAILLFGGVVMLYHFFSKRAKPSLAYLTLVCGWLWAEHFYLNAEISFPWLVLGNGFAGDVWAVQWYEYTGVLGGSLWVLLANIAIFEALQHRTKPSAVRAGVVALLPVVVSLAIFWSYKPE